MIRTCKTTLEGNALSEYSFLEEEISEGCRCDRFASDFEVEPELSCEAKSVAGTLAFVLAITKP